MYKPVLPSRPTKPSSSCRSAMGRRMLFWMGCFLLTACAAKPLSKPVAQNRDAVTLPYPNILILSPQLKFERLRDEATVDPAEFGAAAIDSTLRAEAERAVVGARFGLVRADSTSAEDVDGLCAELSSLSSRLSAGKPNEAARRLLRRMTSVKPNLIVLAQYLNVKVGAGGYWDPFSGAIGSSTSKSVLRASLIHCSSGDVLWNNEVLMRTIPKPNHNSEFAESLRALYVNFPKRKEK